MQWPTLITAAVAVYGALLSTYSVVVRHREKKRWVAVTVSIGFPVYEGLGLGPTVLFISASNPGSRNVSLCNPGLLLPDKRKLVFPTHQSDVQFPHDLEPGKGCRMWIPARILARDLKEARFSATVKLVGFYLDATGTVYKSKPYKFEVNKWLSEAD